MWNGYLSTRPRSNAWKPGWKQADTRKMFTLFQNFADLCLKKLRFFLDFANSRLPLKDNPIFRESGYERATRFARMGGGWCREQIN